MRCGECRFWILDERIGIGKRFGECHRAPPQCDQQRHYRAGLFPLIDEDNFCGEFQAIDQPAEGA